MNLHDAILAREIIAADISRDGGSYSLCFYTGDRQWNEFCLPDRFEGDVVVGYDEPLLYRQLGK